MLVVFLDAILFTFRIRKIMLSLGPFPKSVRLCLWLVNIISISLTFGHQLPRSGILRDPPELTYLSKTARLPRTLTHPKVYRCGDIGKDLVVNFVNKNYPDDDVGGFDCKFRLIVSSPHICQIRVDFVDTELMTPIRGDCLSQHFEVEGPVWATGLPPLCGINNDQHFYLHLEPWSANTSLVDFKVVTIIKSRPFRFGVWLTQIDCSTFNVLKAPEGCTQYFLSERGILKSFNYEGYRYLNGQNYQICIRPSKGVCGIRYEATPGDFSVKKSITAARDVQQRSGTGAAICGTDYLMIPEGRQSIQSIRSARLLFRRRRPAAAAKPAPVAQTRKRRRPEVQASWDRFCGGNLSPVGGENANKPIFARVRSNLISIKVRTSPLQQTNGQGQAVNLTAGFRISYFQLKDCEDNETDMASQPSITNLIHSFHFSSYSATPLLREPDSENNTSPNINNSSMAAADDDTLWDYLDENVDAEDTDQDYLYDF